MHNEPSVSAEMETCVNECLHCYSIWLGMAECVEACRRCSVSCRQMAG